ncbi:APC family permease [Rothia sp. p3-SID1597]|nr:APC family permease [Rothia sp. p3-SID1597]
MITKWGTVDGLLTLSWAAVERWIRTRRWAQDQRNAPTETTSGGAVAYGIVQTLPTRLRRALFGAPKETEQIRSLVLSKRSALAVFGADGFSAIAYAPDEIIMVLALAGTAGFALSPWVGLGVAIVLLLVIGTYRYNIRDVAVSGGDYHVVTELLGPKTGAAAGVSLLFDFVLTVSVSVSSAATYLMDLIPAVAGHRQLVAVCLVIILTLVFIRGLRFMGRVAFIPAALFVVCLTVTLGVGLVEAWSGSLGQAPSHDFYVRPETAESNALTGMGLFLLVARSFSSGAVTLTGVESVSNSVRFFRPPKAQNAARSLTITGVATAVVLVVVLYLARASGAVVTMDSTQLVLNGQGRSEDFQQMPILAQVGEAVGGHGVMFYALVISTVLFLLMAPAAAYAGFPILASTMAEKGYLPVHFRARSNRSLYANGVLVLGASAAVVTLAFGADVNALIQLYVVGVLFSMSLTQTAVFLRRRREIRVVLDAQPRRRLLRDQIITAIGLIATVLATVVVLLTKLTQGAWVTVLVVGVVTMAAWIIKKHYSAIERELAVTQRNPLKALPSRVHAIVVVPRLRKPALRALAYARATRTSTIEALVLNVDEAGTRKTRQLWDRYEVPVPLTILASPYRDPVLPVVEHVRGVRQASPRDVVIVYVPEYVLEHWWDKFLHHRSGHKIAKALRREPGVVTAVVPWRLGHEDEEMLA